MEKTWVKRTSENEVAKIVETRIGINSNNYPIENMDNAVSCFLDHLKPNCKIHCHTDYDIDGLGCGSNLYWMFAALTMSNIITKSQWNIYIPKRFSDGYGCQEKHVDVMNLNPGDLVILADNGITANEAVDKIRAIGADVIILDHHEARYDENGNIMLPNANVIVDEHIFGSDWDHCASGLTFRFMQDVLKKLQDKIAKPIITQSLRYSCVITGIATIADSVKLKYENRTMVKKSITLLNHKIMPQGIQILFDMLWLRGKVNEEDFKFKVNPLLLDRLEDDGAQQAFEIITYDGKYNPVIKQKCEHLKAMNELRKTRSDEEEINAIKYVENNKLENNNFLTIYLPTCEEGLAGIVAGRIKDKYYIPTIILTNCMLGDDFIKGSGRSIPEIDIKAVLDVNKKFVYQHGGHPEAAGLTVEKSKLNDLSFALNSTCDKFVRDDSVLEYDIEITEDKAEELFSEISDNGPYGEGNNLLVIRIDDINLQPVADGYLSMLGTSGKYGKLHSKYLDIMLFGNIPLWVELGKPKKISVIGTLSQQIYKGEVITQLSVIDMKANSDNKEKSLGDFLNGFN